MALWTDEEVAHLNAFQQAGNMHPFTCPNVHGDGSNADRTLIATPEGWRCKHCDYRQDWAHGFMLTWPLPDESG